MPQNFSAIPRRVRGQVTGQWTYSLESVLRFKLLCGIHVIVDACKASGTAATECSCVTECEDDICCGAVERCELLLDVVLGDVCLTRVDDVHNLNNRRGASVKI